MLFRSEVVTRNTDIDPYGNNDWNENNLKNLTTNNWRASLVPAAAVIPAPIAYIKVVAVKKLVVGSRSRTGGPSLARRSLNCRLWGQPRPAVPRCSSPSVAGGRNLYFEQIRVLKAGVETRPNNPAWNNGIGPRFCFVGF